MRNFQKFLLLLASVALITWLVWQVSPGELARALRDLNWRTQEELDDLVRAAGFEQIAMEIDEFGISTVSLARRI